MKHCLVPGSTARCAISSLSHGLLSKPSSVRRVELAVWSSSHGSMCMLSRNNHTCELPTLLTSIEHAKQGP